MDGVEIGMIIARMQAQIAEIEARDFDERYATAAAVAELAENIAALRVQLDALTPSSEDESETESEDEEVSDALDALEGEPTETDDDETAVEVETQVILDDIAEAIDDVIPTRNHLLMRRVVG